jgi:VanZ family protein
LTTPHHRSSTVPLALAYAALIAYASQYPFSDWTAPPRLNDLRWLHLPWHTRFSQFDGVANLLGYFPFGTLLYIGALRGGCSRLAGALGALLLASSLSYAMEVTQAFLPQRVPSLLDWLLNSAGAGLGVGLGMLLQRIGLIAQWQLLRERWVVAHSAGVLALLVLWPLGLLFPAPVPLGTGQLTGPMRELAHSLAESAAQPWLQRWAHEAQTASRPLSPFAEGVAVTLGVVAPCLLAFSIVRKSAQRLAAAAMIGTLGFGATTLSTALNFGPQHALAWLTPAAVPAMAAGLALAALLAFVPRRAAAGIGVLAFAALVALVTQAPADPYYASSLQAWEQGRFIRFHGVAGWIGWLWPFLSAALLLRHLVGAEPGQGSR